MVERGCSVWVLAAGRKMEGLGVWGEGDVEYWFDRADQTEAFDSLRLAPVIEI